jgi:hypothetical protein
LPDSHERSTRLFFGINVRKNISPPARRVNDAAGKNGFSRMREWGELASVESRFVFQPGFAFHQVSQRQSPA